MLSIMYSTSAFARLTRVTVKSLRYYERLGLLVPKRTRAGYRQYSADDLQQLERILALKSLHVPLTIVHSLKPTRHWLARHRGILEEKARHIHRAITTVTRIEDSEAPEKAVRPS